MEEEQKEERRGGRGEEVGRNLKLLPKVAPGGSVNGHVPKKDNCSRWNHFSELLFIFWFFQTPPITPPTGWGSPKRLAPIVFRSCMFLGNWMETILKYCAFN